MAISKIPSAGFQDNVKFRNILINGDMSIAQRGTSQASAGDASGTYDTVDRFAFANQNMGAFTISQDTDVPSAQGFAKSLKLDCTTADSSPATNDYLILQQPLEGQNLQYLKKGTSSAESLTVSFWVKSNKTGTYITQLRDNDNSRNISKSYTIDTADTWEKKTITYAGDTTGTLDNDNNNSFALQFWLGAGTDFTSGTLNTSWNSVTNANRAVGQVNLADSTSNEWYITGVQLETGETASDFEFLPHDVNLQRCQRYYFLKASHSRSSAAENIGVGFYYTSSDMRAIVPFPTEMRARPSIDVVSASNAYQLRRNGGFDNVDDFVLDGNVSLSGTAIQNNTDASGTAGQAGHLFTNSSSGFLAFDAEL